MDQIYIKIRKIVIELSNKYNINIDNYLKRKKAKKIKNNVNDLFNNNEEIKPIEENDEIKFEEQEKEQNKEIIQEQPQKILEFNENINNMNSDLDKNLNETLSNLMKNITFFKNNSTIKDTLLHGDSPNNLLNKKTKFKNSIISNSNKLNLSKGKFNSKISKKSNDTKTIINQYNNNIFNFSSSFIKCNTLKSVTSDKLSNNETKNLNSKKNSSIYPNFNASNKTKIIIETNSSNSSSSSKIKSKNNKKSSSLNEIILYNTFTNLTKTQEKSFQLNSSYENINKISNNKYIKDIKLQSKIKQVLINECLGDNLIKKKSSFLQLPGVSNNLRIIKTPKSSYKSLINFGCALSELENDKNDNISKLSSQNLNKEKCSIDRTMTSRIFRSQNNIRYDIDSSKNKKDSLYSSLKPFQLRKTDKSISYRNDFELKKGKTPIIESKKTKGKTIKKKPVKINKQLNIISKNIENTSKNINNPGEFYMDLFNNIIARESISMNGDEDEDNNSNKNNNILGLNSGNKRDSHFSGKSYINEPSSIESSFSIKVGKTKDFNINSNKTKNKRKSAFNSKI